MRLFVTRAQAVTPEFSLTDTNARAIAQVCRQLDGIPLALELAATRVRVLAVEQIAMHLDDRFSLLKAENHSALPRHQTLRATLDWSYELLSPPEKILFRRLSIFAGGWGLEAAEAVCMSDELAGHKLLDLLSRLVDKSLVTMQEHHGAARYNFLETIRVYAQEKMQTSDELNEIHRRHLEFFLRLADEPYTRVNSWFYKERFLKESYGLEVDNFRTALIWSLSGHDIERGARLTASLLWFWNIANYMSEGNEWLSKVFAFGSRVSPSVRANALETAIVTYQRRGKYQEAIAFGEASVAIYRELGDMPSVARALGTLARALCDQGNLERAIALAEEAIHLNRELGPENLAVSLRTLATARQLQGDFEGSVPILEESIALAEKYDDENGKNEPLGLLARVYRKRGDYTRATLLYNESMAYSWKTGFTFRLAFGLEFYAVLATLQKQAERAARLWGAAHAFREGTGIPRPASQKDYAESERDARRQLDAKTFGRLFTEGGAMPLEEAVKYAMAAPIPNAADASPPPPSEETLMRKTAGLTGREYEVAMRVAQGVSNREIAAQLFVSERTIEKHVGNLLSKLHLNSRTQLAAWVLERAWLKHS